MEPACILWPWRSTRHQQRSQQTTQAAQHHQNIKVTYFGHGGQYVRHKEVCKRYWLHKIEKKQRDRYKCDICFQTILEAATGARSKTAQSQDIKLCRSNKICQNQRRAPAMTNDYVKQLS